jgi:hypothetical protein
MERRTAVLLLRPPTGELSVGVTWPANPGGPRPVVLLLAPDRFASTSRAECAAALADGSGVVVADLRCGGTQVGGRVDGAEVDAAAYTLGWLADHATQLAADPAAVVVARAASAVHTAWAVTARARAAGWPPVARHVRLHIAGGGADEFAAAAESDPTSHD